MKLRTVRRGCGTGKGGREFLDGLISNLCSLLMRTDGAGAAGIRRHRLNKMRLVNAKAQISGRIGIRVLTASKTNRNPEQVIVISIRLDQPNPGSIPTGLHSIGAGGSPPGPRTVIGMP